MATSANVKTRYANYDADLYRTDDNITSDQYPSAMTDEEIYDNLGIKPITRTTMGQMLLRDDMYNGSLLEPSGRNKVIRKSGWAKFLEFFTPSGNGRHRGSFRWK